MKRNLKKLVSLLLAAVLLAACLPLSASAAEYDIRVYGEHRFKINIDTGELVEYKGPGGPIIIPEGVIKIKPYLFWNSASITNVLLPASLLEIGAHAFDGSGLAGPLVIREDVTKIGAAAFQNTAITSVVMAPGVTEIGSAAFKNCKFLLNAEVFYIEIGEQAFSGCGLLHQVYIGPTALNIGARQFYNCASLKTFDVPGHVSKIEPYAFAGSGVKDMTIPGHVKTVGACAFERCPNLTRVHFDRGVEELGETMFATTPALKELWIPETVTELKGHRPLSGEGYVVHGIPGSPVHQYIEKYNALNHPEIPFVDDYDAPGMGSGMTPAFTDVPANEYYADPVKWAVANEVTAGTTATTFGPNDNCTRAQFVTFLWRAAGKPESTSSNNPFVDVPEDYYTKAVLWAAEKGIVYGTDDTHFSPSQPVQRAQAVTFLYRFAGKPAVTGANKFTDVKSDDYFRDAVLWGEQNGVVYGTSTTVFSPTNTCVRAQTVTFLYRYLGK